MLWARGSPPLARGTDGISILSPCRGRITPAYAGNSYSHQGQRGKNQDHPRLRGEQFADCITVIFVPGSPPLARGTVVANIKRASLFRITPACAGNRPHKQNTWVYAWDHPRLRGEQAAIYRKPDYG